MKKLITLIVLFASTVVSAGTLVVNSNQSGESSKAAFDAYVDAFRAAHPEVTVVVNEFEHEAYKTAIRNFLTRIILNRCRKHYFSDFSFLNNLYKNQAI